MCTEIHMIMCDDTIIYNVQKWHPKISLSVATAGHLAQLFDQDLRHVRAWSESEVTRHPPLDHWTIGPLDQWIWCKTIGCPSYASYASVFRMRFMECSATCCFSVILESFLHPCLPIQRKWRYFFLCLWIDFARLNAIWLCYDEKGGGRWIQQTK